MTGDTNLASRKYARSGSAGASLSHADYASDLAGRRAQGAVFWVLLAMGFIGFAPCVLLPEWRQYESLQLAEHTEAYRLEQMERVVERERAFYEALRDDPAVLARLAQRDLSFRRLDQQAVPVRSEYMIDEWWADGDSFINVQDESSRSSLVASIVARLPHYHYDAVFCDDRTRSIVMTMSIALIALAFGLFPGRKITRG